MQTSYASFTDLFCGAGGSSEGARQADSRVEVRIAVNHWRTAVETHAKNFPGTDHDCADISACDPRRYPPTTFLIASPECTNYTRAKGKRRANLPATDLWGQPTLSEAEERSRATMWDPLRFAEYHRYPFVIIENVVDIRLWTLYDAWLSAWRALGYDYRECYFNSMFFHPTPQSRDRLYIVFWRREMVAPDLDYRPQSWCSRCERFVGGVQSWKNPAKCWGKYGQRNQYLYCCPTCAQEVQPLYVSAAAVIDWSLPIERIGDRKRPLVERTLRRIKIGLDKFRHHALLVNYVHSGHDPSKVRSAAQPWPTHIANQTQGLVVPPFPVGLAHTHGHDHRAYAITGPAPVQTGTRTYGLVVPPFLVSLNHSDDRLRSLDQPLPTTMPHTTPALCVPPFVAELRGGGSDARSLDEPLSAVTAGGHHHALVMPPPFISSYYGQGGEHTLDEAMPTVTGKDKHALIVPPFVLSYYGGRDAIQTLGAPLPTVPTMNRHALVQPDMADEIKVEDCGFRMFKVPEIRRAMAFPDGYVLLGNQDDQIKLLGNAVTPPPMTWMVRQCLAVYGQGGS